VLIRLADRLSHAVDSREKVLLDQLRGGPDTVMHLEFRQNRGFDPLARTLSVQISASIFGSSPPHNGWWYLARRVPERRCWLFICCSTSYATEPP